MTIPPISKGPSDDRDALQMLADHLGQQERWNRGDHESNRGKAERMSEAVRFPLSPRGKVERNFVMRLQK